jgi:hypothetical protein
VVNLQEATFSFVGHHVRLSTSKFGRNDSKVSQLAFLIYTDVISTVSAHITIQRSKNFSGVQYSFDHRLYRSNFKSEVHIFQNHSEIHLVHTLGCSICAHMSYMRNPRASSSYIILSFDFFIGAISSPISNKTNRTNQNIIELTSTKFYPPLFVICERFKRAIKVVNSSMRNGVGYYSQSVHLKLRGHTSHLPEHHLDLFIYI